MCIHKFNVSFTFQGRRCRRVVVGFTITYTISVYHHLHVVSSNPTHCEVYSIQRYVIKFVSDLRQIKTNKTKTKITLWRQILTCNGPHINISHRPSLSHVYNYVGNIFSHVSCHLSWSFFVFWSLFRIVVVRYIFWQFLFNFLLHGCLRDRDRMVVWFITTCAISA